MSDLTKREHLAGMAMQGHCSNNADQFRLAGPVQLAEWSVKCADALLAELDKTAPKPVADDKWINHFGGPNPCADHVFVDYIMRDNDEDHRRLAGLLDWSHHKSETDIIAWRPAR